MHIPGVYVYTFPSINGIILLYKTVSKVLGSGAVYSAKPKWEELHDFGGRCLDDGFVAICFYFTVYLEN